MNRKEILTKAVRQAKANGWHIEYDPPISGEAYRLFIFSHSFAQALWPPVEHTSTNVYTGGGRGGYFRDLDPEWVRHLQAMVVADDPIEYLRQNAL